MKKFTLICLSILICIGLCGCDVLVTDTSETKGDFKTNETELQTETELESENETLITTEKA